MTKNNAKSVNDAHGFVLTNVAQVSDDIATIIASAPANEGGICMVTGPLKSGKSLVVLHLNQKFSIPPHTERNVCFCQPAVYRPDVPMNKITSRSGGEMDAFSYENKTDIQRLFRAHDVILLNEFQFTPFELQSALVQEIMLLKQRGGWFVGLGLYHTSQGGRVFDQCLIANKSHQNI